MKRTAVAVLSWLLISLIVTPLGWARPQYDLDAVLANLKPGKKVRIDSRTQGRIQGRYQAVSEDTLMLQGDEGVREVELDEIERLWVHGNRRRTGALIGALAGSLAVVFLHADSEDCLPDIPCGGSGGGSEAALSLAGALAGGGLGAAAGAAIPDWKLRYRRPQSD